MDVTGNYRAWLKLRKMGGWRSSAWDLGEQLRPAAAVTSNLFVVGTDTFDAWHVAAHFHDQARRSNLPGLSPTLLRWNPPATAPPHLRHSAHELAAADRRSAVLVIAPDRLHDDGLQRLADARRRGAALFTVTSDGELASLAHEGVLIGPDNRDANERTLEDFVVASHLVTVSAATASRPERHWPRLSLPRRSAFTQPAIRSAHGASASHAAPYPAARASRTAATTPTS